MAPARKKKQCICFIHAFLLLDNNYSSASIKNQSTARTQGSNFKSIKNHKNCRSKFYIYKQTQNPFLAHFVWPAAAVWIQYASWMRPRGSDPPCCDSGGVTIPARTARPCISATCILLRVSFFHFFLFRSSLRATDRQGRRQRARRDAMTTPRASSIGMRPGDAEPGDARCELKDRSAQGPTTGGDSEARARPGWCGARRRETQRCGDGGVEAGYSQAAHPHHRRACSALHHPTGSS